MLAYDDEFGGENVHEFLERPRKLGPFFEKIHQTQAFRGDNYIINKNAAMCVCCDLKKEKFKKTPDCALLII